MATERGRGAKIPHRVSETIKRMAMEFYNKKGIYGRIKSENCFIKANWSVNYEPDSKKARCSGYIVNPQKL